MPHHQPLYRHDCDACRHMATRDDVDVYFCSNFNEIILRFSSDGPDYTVVQWDALPGMQKTWLENLPVFDAKAGPGFYRIPGRAG